ncbi:MAG TPA: DUF6263 family protein [Gemmataceae bacterium]
MLRRALFMMVGLTLALAVAAPAQEEKKAEKKEPPAEKKAEKAPPKKAEEKKAEEKKGEKAAPKDDGLLRMQWKLEKDKPFYQEMTTRTVQHMKVMGMDVDQTQEQTFYFKWTPVEQTDGKWKIQQKIDGVKMKIDIAGNPISYDSTAAGGGANSALAEFFRSLVGAEFTLTLDENFKVVNVEGRDAFLKKLTQANQAMEPLLKQILSDEALKQMADPTFGAVPPEPKKVGDTWTSTTTLDLGPIGTYENKHTYTYKGKDETDKKLDRIEVTTDLTYKAPSENKEGLPFQIDSAELKSTDPKPGVILWNPETGRVESARFEVKLDGNLKLTIGGMKTTVDLKQEQTTEMKTSDQGFIKAG